MSKAAKKAKTIHPIDLNTRYDVPGRLRQLAQSIEDGNFGTVTDVAFSLRFIHEEGVHVKSFVIGSSQSEVVHYMACSMVKDFMR